MSMQHFHSLGSGISVYRPSSHGDTSQTDAGGDEKHNGQPTELAATITEPAATIAGPAATIAEPQPALIILCTWLGGATPKRIERYTRGYHELWPRSTILLIQTTATEYAFFTDGALRDKLAPARHEIRRAIAAADHSRQPSTTSADGPRAEGLLLHMFSNGGANIATQLVASTNAMMSRAASAVTTTSSSPSSFSTPPLPLRQIVLDSCPGDLNVACTYAAAAHSIPRSNPLRPLFCAVLYLTVVTIAGLEAVGLRRPLAKSMRRQLNDPAVFSPAAARLYLTSRADVIVDTSEVSSHREEAAAVGLRTDMVVFEKAGHCGLLVEDEGAYWRAIESSWRRAGLDEPGTCEKSEVKSDEERVQASHRPVTVNSGLSNATHHVRCRL